MGVCCASVCVLNDYKWVSALLMSVGVGVCDCLCVE